MFSLGMSLIDYDAECLVCGMLCRNVSVSFYPTGIEGSGDCFGGWGHCLRLRHLSSPLRSQESLCLLQERIHQHQSRSRGGTRRSHADDRTQCF